LEGVAHEGNVLQPPDEDGDAGLVQKVPRKHEEEHRHGRGDCGERK